MPIKKSFEYLVAFFMPPELFYQLFRFGITGLCCAAIHFFLVILLVQTQHILPLIANVYAAFISFQCSYWGHRLWTFRGTETLHMQALPKLLLVQLIALSA